MTRHGSRHYNGEPGGGYAAQNHVEVTAPAMLRRGEETVVRSLRRAVKDMVFLNSRWGLYGCRRDNKKVDFTFQNPRTPKNFLIR